MYKPKVYSAENFRCQKCLEIGHFTYLCTGKRKYVSRTPALQKKLKADEKEETIASNAGKREAPPVDGIKEMKGEVDRRKTSNSSVHSDDSTSEDSESDSTSSSSSASSSSSSASQSRSSSSSSSSSNSSSSSSSGTDSDSSSSSASNS